MRLHTWILLMIASCLPAVFAAPVTVTLRDHLGRSWDDELVHYRLTFAAGEWTGAAVARVVAATGADLPTQLSDIDRDPDGAIRAATVWFRVTVPVAGEVVCTIRPGEASPAPSTLTVKTAADSVELTTRAPQAVGIRLPLGAGDHEWPVPVSQVPAPVLGMLLPSGQWLGAGRIEAPFLVRSWDARVTASGPVFAEVAVRYTFDVGYWHFTVRVVDGTPAVMIEEDLDTGSIKQAWDELDRFFILPLGSDGFRPSQAFYACNRNDQPHFQDLLAGGVPEVSKKCEIRGNWYSANVYGYTVANAPAGDHVYLSAYGSVMNRLAGFARVQQPGGDAIGAIGLSTERWRNAMSLRLRADAQGHLALYLPLQVYEQEWAVDGYGRGSPNYTGKTLFVPETTARRRYAIALTPAVDETQNLLVDLSTLGSKLGALPLQEVKDWQLDWPDPMADAAWAAETSPEALKVLTAMRDRIAMRQALGNYAEFSMAYHYGYSKGRWPGIRAVIDDPARLTAADRREIRRLAAFDAYDFNRTATFPWGTGFHLNNPNMSIMAVEARAKSSVLIRDHAMFRPWAEWTLAFTRDFFDRMIFPSGAHYENPHYSIGVTLDWGAQVNAILIENGIGDAFATDRFTRGVRFTLDWLTPPDPRFLGHRQLVSIGNGSYQSFTKSFAEQFVAYYKERNPELAGQLQWAANQTFPADKQLALVEDIVPPLGSVHYPNYGVYFRHGFGTPYETFFLLMAGDCHGHYELESDQMAYTLYAKGQPINLHFGNGYFPMLNRPWLRNRVSIDHSFEKSERNPTQILATAFTPEAEYLRASRHIDMIRPLQTEVPSTKPNGQWDEEEAKNWPVFPQWQQIPMTVWFRQAVFVKDADPRGPNYFVLRDDFGGVPTRPTDLNLWFLSTEFQREADTFHFIGQCEVDMDVFLHTPAGAPHETGEYTHRQQPYGRLVGFEPKYHPDGKLQERQQLLRLKQPAGQGYLVVLYPRLKENDPPAAYTRLADNVVKVVTPLSSDIVFVNPHAFTAEVEGIRFAGTSAIVRQYPGGKVTVTNHDGAVTLTVAGKTITGSGPFVVTIEAGQATAKTFAADATVNVQ